MGNSFRRADNRWLFDFDHKSFGRSNRKEISGFDPEMGDNYPTD